MLDALCPGVPAQETLLNSAWGMLHNRTKLELENKLNCCGLLDTNATHAQFDLDVSTCNAVSFTPPATLSSEHHGLGIVVDKEAPLLQTRTFKVLKSYTGTGTI